MNNVRLIHWLIVPKPLTAPVQLTVEPITVCIFFAAWEVEMIGVLPDDVLVPPNGQDRSGLDSVMCNDQIIVVCPAGFGVYKLILVAGRGVDGWLDGGDLLDMLKELLQ